MPRSGYYAYITPVERPGWGGGGPVDPDYGIDEGGHPDQGLPPGYPGRPGHLPARPGRPVDPGYGWGGERPSHGLPRPGRPVDPGYGIEEGGAGHLPVWPVDPSHPIAPPIPGEPNPPVDPPPGTIWPPLPPGSNVTGKALALVWIQGVGYRYVVIQIDVHPDQGLPPEQPGQPDQGLPQPPTPQPKGLRR
jgi:hypothetical protein